jgi:hypothetical protein
LAQPPESTRSERLLGATALAVFTVAFWKYRIIDSAFSWFSVANLDLFIGQQPMTRYAMDALASGRIPLWNPHQLCGEPFLAIPYVGFFYPPNALHLVTSVPVGFELLFGLHMLLAAAGMALLVREHGLSRLAALVAALTYACSGWLINYVNQPQLHAGLAWMPITVWSVERVIRGSRIAAYGLAAAVALQALNGAMEILLHTLYVAGLYTLFRFAGMLRGPGKGSIIRTGAILLASVAGGMSLAAVQLMPTFELVLQSARGPGELAIEDVLKHGTIGFRGALEYAVGNSRITTAGVLALVAAGFGFLDRRHRLLWGFAVAALVLSLALAQGGALYRLYFELPIGSLFRRPIKFLSIYAFAQALLCGIAVSALSERVGVARAVLWRQVGWWLGLAAAFGAWLAVDGVPPYLVALIALLLVFASLQGARLRGIAIAAIATLHVVSLFLGVQNRAYRPFHFPTFIDDHGERIEADQLRAQLGRDRLYISPKIHMSKQGVISGFGVLADYEPLAPSRYADFFAAAVGERNLRAPFNGRYTVDGDTRWRLMDLAGARLYLFPGEGAPHTANLWTPKSDDFHKVASPIFRVFERESTLPRAYFSPHARLLESKGAALRAIRAPDFDPRGDLVLERDPSRADASFDPPKLPNGSAIELAEAEIIEYEPESVEIVVDAPSRGHLVLTDFHYPGWEATVNGVAAPMWRANYLFRAVAVEAGESRIRFEFHPFSFRLGAWISAIAGTVCIAGFLWTVGTNRRAASSDLSLRSPSSGTLSTG